MSYGGFKGPPRPAKKDKPAADDEDPAKDQTDLPTSEWGPADDEYVEPAPKKKEEGGESKEEKGGMVAQNDFGLGAFAADKIFTIAKEAYEKLRRVPIKIVNRSSVDLIDPQWSFKDGKTQINPDFIIPAKEGIGEAQFEGQTLKGTLSYQIGATDKCLVIVFKVLYFRGFQIAKHEFWKDRQNEVGITVCNLTERGKPHKDNPALFEKHLKELKKCTGTYHVVSIPSSPSLDVRYTISDTGEADVKVFVQDATP